MNNALFFRDFREKFYLLLDIQQVFLSQYYIGANNKNKTGG